jgi:hypothetical protein
VLAGWPTVLLGPVSRFSGLLATATGHYAEAARLLTLAADEAKRCGMALVADQAKRLLQP